MNFDIFIVLGESYMTTYEELLDSVCNKNILVHENYDFSDTHLKGLYCDSHIALSKNLATTAEKRCILTEEYEHHQLSVGDITNPHSDLNRKQEHIAKKASYDDLVGLEGIIRIFEKRIDSIHDAAEELNITEEFFKESLGFYSQKYGTWIKYENYIIKFCPALTVLKLF